MNSDKDLTFEITSKNTYTPEEKFRYIKNLKREYEKLAVEVEILSRYLLYAIRKSIGENEGELL